jgi:hypothetical protein
MGATPLSTTTKDGRDVVSKWKVANRIFDVAVCIVVIVTLVIAALP